MALLGELGTVQEPSEGTEDLTSKLDVISQAIFFLFGDVGLIRFEQIFLVELPAVLRHMPTDLANRS